METAKTTMEPPDTFERDTEAPAKAEGEFTVRRATPDEIASLVIPSWMQSYTRSLLAKFMRADSRYGAGRDRYWNRMRQRIERILSQSTVSVRVVEVEGLDEPAAWVCDDQTTREIHYVYVKETFRRQGIAKQLLPWLNDASAPVFITHVPPPFYTRADEQSGKRLWREHVVIDTLTSY